MFCYLVKATQERVQKLDATKSFTLVLYTPNSTRVFNLLLFFVCVCVCVCSGDASAGGQQPGQREHGAGAGWRSSAALEETGPGATQDCFRPPQAAQLNPATNL